MSATAAGAEHGHYHGRRSARWEDAAEYVELQEFVSAENEGAFLSDERSPLSASDPKGKGRDMREAS